MYWTFSLASHQTFKLRVLLWQENPQERAVALGVRKCANTHIRPHLLGSQPAHSTGAHTQAIHTHDEQNPHSVTRLCTSWDNLLIGSRLLL